MRHRRTELTTRNTKSSTCHLFWTCLPRKPKNICIPTVLCYLSQNVSLEIHIIKSINFYAIWMIKRIDRPVVRTCLVCGFFFLLGETNSASKQPGAIKEKRTREKIMRTRIDVLDRPRIHVLFYVCIALKNIWFPSRWNRPWNYGQPDMCFFHTQGISFARVEVFTLCFFVLSMVLRFGCYWK